jgi:hypothetical protein
MRGGRLSRSGAVFLPTDLRLIHPCAKARILRDKGTAATEAYNQAKAEIDQLRRKLDPSAALDLRWAIFGLYVATTGAALSYLA